MNHPANQLFAAIKRMACTNHRRDSEGWPLGNCIECVTYRKQMDAWYCEQVMAGQHRPGADQFDTDKQASGFEDYTVTPKQAST